MHSWKAYKVAKKIAKALQECGYITTDFEMMKVRGIVQIIIEEEGKYV